MLKKLVVVAALLAASPGTAADYGPTQTVYVRALVDQYAKASGVPRRLAHGIIRVESGYRCDAKNPNSTASGAGQLIQATAAALGVTEVFDCRQNVEASMRYLAKAIRRGGAGCRGVSLYEKGISARLRCTVYGRKVMRMAKL